MRKQSTPSFLKSKHFLPPDTHSYVCVLGKGGGKKCSFFEKFAMFCFLVTSVLRFALLPYYRRDITFISSQFVSLLNIQFNLRLNYGQIFAPHVEVWHLLEGDAYQKAALFPIYVLRLRRLLEGSAYLRRGTYQRKCGIFLSLY